MFHVDHSRLTPIPSNIPPITQQVAQMFFYRRNEGHEESHVSDATNAIISRPTTKYDKSSIDSTPRAKDRSNAPNHLVNPKS